MSKCPDCGRENVDAPAGYIAPCGRRVSSNEIPSEDWKERMQVYERCREAAARREIQKLWEGK